MQILFIGDEITAAGFCLTGAKHLPVDLAADDLTSVLDHQLSEADADLVLLTAEYAEHIDATTLSRYQSRLQPLFLVIADSRHRHLAPDLSREISQRLGMRDDIVGNDLQRP